MFHWDFDSPTAMLIRKLSQAISTSMLVSISGFTETGDCNCKPAENWESMASFLIQMPITCNIRSEWFTNSPNHVVTAAATARNTNGPNPGKNTAEVKKVKGSRFGTHPEPYPEPHPEPQPAINRWLFLYPKKINGDS